MFLDLHGKHGSHYIHASRFLVSGESRFFADSRVVLWLPTLWCQFKSSRAQVFLCHGWGAWCLPWLVLPLVLLGGHWLQWSVTLGGPHDLGHHQGVRLIFQSCYGVGVTFRVAPMWVKCMFCPSLTRNSRKGKKENHIRRRLKSFYMLDLKRLYALEILAVSLMKVAIMDCDAL